MQAQHTAARPQPRARLRRAASSPGSAWQLADAVQPRFAALAAAVESAWREHPATSPLVPQPLPARFAAARSATLQLENRVYEAGAFRKLHLELAAGRPGLSVLHCVMFPHAAHDVPLFALDLVAFGVRAPPPAPGPPDARGRSASRSQSWTSALRAWTSPCRRSTTHCRRRRPVPGRRARCRTGAPGC